eukprot:156082_1
MQTLISLLSIPEYYYPLIVIIFSIVVLIFGYMSQRKPSLDKPNPVIPPRKRFISKEHNNKVEQLNNKAINRSEIDRVLQYGDSNNNISKPFVICLSTKADSLVFDDQKEDSECTQKDDNIAIVYGTTHSQIKKRITEIIYDRYYKNEDKYDGIIVVLLCIVDSTRFNWYFDQNNERRHFEKLTKDIKYRIEGNLAFNYNNVIILNEWMQ